MPQARRKSSRPVMRVLDVLGRRWALRILWELRDGPQTFRALRAACDDVSPSSLNQRLAELRTVGAIERRDEGYALTPPGVRLAAIVLDLHRWAEAMLRAPARKK
jgi:DNA-binding HxlR family transcriptional regulator